ncbi:hypothetical protein AERO_11915 [Aeromicrobium fastidiosum]|uniref:hypothetical protein n=1 Tax=Aeromicrobium fastidiosum TaxID=52699 RepID=UPI0020234D28|nr:hypothetical protein [Aeromicrobium fastidiosum]MCL8252092.1 hypothetical protein [Aeromicrobium fastidiosum]
MAPRPRVPDSLRGRPFSRQQALAAGMTSRQLEGGHLVRPFPRVYVLRGHEMSRADWIAAAALSMPARAQLSHVSRIHAAGLDVGEVIPVHFTIAGDLHLAGDGIRLHRTEVLPPLDDVGVTPAAAFVQHCASATLLEAVAVGDWLLHRRRMSTGEVVDVVRHQSWRPGAHQVGAVLPLLDAGSMSVKESEVRVRLVSAGLPVPEVNVRLEIGGELIGIGDLLMRCVMLVLEYEGRQHAESVRQFNRDIHRYSAFRRHGVEYLQITNEMLEKPKVMVRRVHSRMVELGYDGPPPVFGASWDGLDEAIRRPKRRGR